MPRYVIVLLISLFVSACMGNKTLEANTNNSMTKTSMMTINGSVTYRERILTPKGSMLYVSLNDISRADASSIKMAEQLINMTDRSVPVDYKLEVPMNQIKPNLSYSLRAEIRNANKKLLWVTDTSYLIDPQKITQTMRPIIMVKVGATPPPDSHQKHGLTGIDWRVSDLNGSGVVDRSRSTITFSPSGRVSGSSGCNQFFGDYTNQGDRLTIGRIAMTQRECVPALNNQEVKFFALFNDIDRYVINSSGNLILKTSDGKSITANRP